ncbi:MAG TPA: ATPase, T2SS/T4P/T4SS family [Candidatus Omnitrophota bacterium]|nr:ATPase, T2SS/T4P/T4SS family [Candidatus Omnitrophota bacterium]
MTKTDALIYGALQANPAIDKTALEEAARLAEGNNEPLLAVLKRVKLISESDGLDILSAGLGIPRIDLRGASIDKQTVEKVPSKIAHYYRFVPVKAAEHALTVAVSMPLDIKTQDEIRMQLGTAVEMVLAPADDIDDALKRYYGLAAETLGKMAKAAPLDEPARGRQQEKVEDIEKLAEDASIIQLVNQLILEAFRKRATDIHIEPFRDKVSMRYRVDGILYDANVPIDIKNFLHPIISRIKIMSNLNIVERRLPQDGRAVVKVADHVLDLRISTIPTPFGESVVIRILPTQMLFSLEKLGLDKAEIRVFEELIRKPHGILFVTGPTGSGKTTTLYACLSRLNTSDRKIITIEDPIEYEMSGITQIQVQPEIGMDFARGLRSILRHDPDVIMVGEVRDLETAEIAIRVALTGHLVFSTLHTNDAASGISRLVDIGLEPYLVVSSVEAFIAQRLIRIICPACKYEDTSAPAELKEIIARESGMRAAEDIRIYRGKGCPNCNNTGFLGRTAIYEMLLIDDAIKELVLKKAPASELKRVALSHGMRTLRQDGWQKVIAGVSTPEEVMKVTNVEEKRSGTVSAGQSAAPALVPAVPEAGEADAAAGGNNRVYSRLQERINIRYRSFDVKDVMAQRGISYEELSCTRNISAGGLLFIGHVPPPGVGAILELTIELEKPEAPIECLARIVRVHEVDQQTYDIAVCFLDLTGAQRARLEKYVQGETRF